MVRDITKEEQEAIKKAAWEDGYAYGLGLANSEAEKREKEAERRGIRIGRNQVLKEMEQVQWRRLFGLIVLGSVIGCGIILAVGIGLSYLP